MSNKKRSSVIDLYVADRLKGARLAAGMSQQEAGRYLDVTFQQLQKYEKGVNRVSAGALAVFAHIYGRPIEWFYEGAPGALDTTGQGARPDLAAQLLNAAYGAQLATDYVAIEHNVDRRVVADVAAALAGRTPSRSSLAAE